MSDVINFYSVSADYGCFSNFAAYPIRLGGKTWPTSEHYFQAQKFEDDVHQEAIRQTPSPMIAARMGRDRKRPLRPDWETVKIAIMREVVRAKFTQHDDIRDILLSTGEAKLVEHTKNDAYWGDGGDGSGQNMLGRILMEVREEFRNKRIQNPLIEIWRSIIIGDQKSWVLFSNGTCVILMEPEDNLSSQALALLKEWGPVHVGSSAGDFSTIDLTGASGWVVTSHHNDILTYVGPEEIEQPEPSDLIVGLHGRSKRDQDAHELKIIHIEDKRHPPSG